MSDTFIQFKLKKQCFFLAVTPHSDTSPLLILPKSCAMVEKKPCVRKALLIIIKYLANSQTTLNISGNFIV
ncbi:MAG: hypothetical protein ACPGVP_22275, partial [Thiolinea sp.]